MGVRFALVFCEARRRAIDPRRGAKNGWGARGTSVRSLGEVAALAASKGSHEGRCSVGGRALGTGQGRPPKAERQWSNGGGEGILGRWSMGRGEGLGLGWALAEAWQACGVVDIGAEILPVDREGAYLVQDKMAAALEREFGETVAGWKVGATSVGVQRAEGYDGPIPGRIFGATVYRDGAVVPRGRLQQASVEAEVGFRFGSEPKGREGVFSPENLVGFVEAMPALDITSTRFAAGRRVGWTPRQKMLAGIADNGNGGLVVLGEAAADWQGLDLAQMLAALRVNGGAAAPHLLGTRRRDPLEALAWTLNHVYERGFGIRAGDVVLTGSLTEPQEFHAGDRVECSMPGLGSVRCQVSLA